MKICDECVRQMLEHARQAAPQECCGLLAGRGGVITQVYPATNAFAASDGVSAGEAASHPASRAAGATASRARTEFEIAPAELFQILKQMRAAGLDHLGIYHSHPASENVPSPRDIERAYYQEVAYFILSPRADALRPVRAFAMEAGAAEELEVEEVQEGED